MCSSVPWYGLHTLTNSMSFEITYVWYRAGRPRAMLGSSTIPPQLVIWIGGLVLGGGFPFALCSQPASIKSEPPVAFPLAKGRLIPAFRARRIAQQRCKAPVSPLPLPSAQRHLETAQRQRKKYVLTLFIFCPPIGSILWMDEILHDLRHPGMIRFPPKYKSLMVATLDSFTVVRMKDFATIQCEHRLHSLCAV